MKKLGLLLVFFLACSQTSGSMKLSSLAFSHENPIPSVYTCDGENLSPSLSIEGVPENTVSLVLVVDDPDAPRGDWVHWLLWNMDPNTTEILENSVPSGAVQGMTDFGTVGWGGPCPPSGTHRYFFKLYALDTKLEIPPSANKAQLEEALKDHVLDKAELMGTYSRA